MKRCFVIFGILLMVSAASAQEGIVRKAYDLSISSRTEFRTWSKSSDEGESFRVSQLSLPLSIRHAVTRNITVDLLSSSIVSSAEGDSLSGIRDLKARTVMMLADDRVMMSLGLNLPMGESAMSEAGEAVSTLLADRAMKFRYNNLGEGFDISLNTGLAQQLGPLVLGGGVAYLKKGEYKLLEGKDEKYHPGDQLTVTGGVDMVAGPMLLSADTTYTSYQPDKFDGAEVYQEEDGIATQASAYLGARRIQILASGRYTIRGTPKALQDGSLEENVSLYGDQFDLRGVLRLPFSDAYSVLVLTDLILIGKNENERNDAVVTGLGTGMTYRRNRSSHVSLEGRYFFGSADDGESSLNGLSGVFSILLSF